MSNLSSLRARSPADPRTQPGSQPSGESSARRQAPRPFIFSTSLEPAHIALNLRILGFIEELRASPVADDPPLQTDTSETPPPRTNNISVSTSIPPTSITSATTPSSSTEYHTHLINVARKLLASAKALPNPSDRTTYEHELRNVWSLLAYASPSSAPAHLRRYLDQSRRDAVAAQVNGAILSAYLSHGLLMWHRADLGMNF